MIAFINVVLPAPLFPFIAILSPLNNLSLILLALGPGQIVLIALAIILLFGVNKIPQLMKGVGRGIKDFKEEMKDDSTTEDDSKIEEE